jgi:hypothetical protein
MDTETEAGVQRIIDLEIALIIVFLGIDMLIQTLSIHDTVATLLLLTGFAIVGSIYWHTLYLDNLFAGLHEGIHHLIHHTTTTETTIVGTSSPTEDIPLATVSDRPILHVNNFLLSKNFYEQALAPLGYRLTMSFPALSMASFGIGRTSDVWIKGDGVGQKIRASFTASTKSAVDTFFENAINAGGTEAEVPGVRTERGPHLYAAAVYDPDGYTIEAVCTE